MKRKKIGLWRIFICIISIIFIVFMWVKNDIARIYSTMPKEQVFPLIITTLLVSLLKVLAIAGGILLIKWLFDKFKTKK